ncbi:hypothetical protein DJ568_15300 [Mucilaginibacter hurinus]|uniref:Entericidin n=1 Tax=Mucilaginibacter hurinus TaxID=2201324 RepID=A0A367GK99_9SPHI|nr:hypothetical protein [Mucilaginibacter hurinus]RCH53904.1 hypothetical protein DJ568_15300 [Mucilaginibacter hurinus]
MKNAFKLGFLAVAISLSVVACGGNKEGDGADTTVTDSSTIITDTTSVDSTVTTDSAGTDTTVTTEVEKTETH